MIRITLGTNTSRVIKTVDPSIIIKTFLEENNVDYTTSNYHLDGCPLTAADMNKSFADMGITESAFLLSVIKADNALTV